MDFNQLLKKALVEKNISQVQLAKMIGKSKSSVSQYLSGKHIPSMDVQNEIISVLDLREDYFKDVSVRSTKSGTGMITRLSVEDAATYLGMNHNTVRKGLQQGVFPWGYAIHTSANQWAYFINARKFFEIERCEHGTDATSK